MSVEIITDNALKIYYTWNFSHLDVSLVNVIKNKSAYSSHIFTFCLPCWHLKICSLFLQLYSLKFFYVPSGLLWILHYQVKNIHMFHLLFCFNHVSPLSYSELRLIIYYCLFLTQVVPVPTLEKVVLIRI